MVDNIRTKKHKIIDTKGHNYILRKTAHKIMAFYQRHGKKKKFNLLLYNFCEDLKFQSLIMSYSKLDVIVDIIF